MYLLLLLLFFPSVLAQLQRTVFYTVGPHNGRIGNRSQANLLCGTDVCSSPWALLGYEDDNIAAFPFTRGHIITTRFSDVAIAADSTALEVLNIAYETHFGKSWTGMNRDGTANVSMNCNEWQLEPACNLVGASSKNSLYNQVESCEHLRYIMCGCDNVERTGSPTTGGPSASPTKTPSKAPTTSTPTGVPTQSPLPRFNMVNTKILPAVQNEDDLFGISTSISDDGFTMAVGATGADGGTTYVFYRTSLVSGWSATVIELQGDDGIGSTPRRGEQNAISGDGNTIVQCDPNDDDGVGACWVFARDAPDAWTQQSLKLVGTGGSGPGEQGSAVAISDDGDTIAVGAYKDADLNGSVWIFVRDGDDLWTQQARLFPNNTVGAAHFGISLAFSADGNTLFAGGDHDDNLNGAVWLYTRDEEDWIQGAKITHEFGLNSIFAGSLAVSADATTFVARVENTRSIVVYQLQNSIWQQLGSTIRPVQYTADFGRSLAISEDGNYVVAGDPGFQSNRGIVRGYIWNGTIHMERPDPIFASDYVGSAIYQGFSVSISAEGTSVAFGGYGDDTNKGSVWVYDTLLTQSPTTAGPSKNPTTSIPSKAPTTSLPTTSPTTSAPSESPTTSLPSRTPSRTPSNSPTTSQPSKSPSTSLPSRTPSKTPSRSPSTPIPSHVPTKSPSAFFSVESKLVSTSYGGADAQGFSVSLSGDALILISGGYLANSNQGVAYAYRRESIGDAWSAPFLLEGDDTVSAIVYQGYSVAVSRSSFVAVQCGRADASNTGACWVFTRALDTNTWTQRGTKLTGSGSVPASFQGFSVAISDNGATIAVGAAIDDSNKGAAWIYLQDGIVWEQEDTKLVPNDAVGTAQFGSSIAISADGNTAVIGGPNEGSGGGAVWVFTRTAGDWTQFGSKITVGGTGFGVAVAVRADGLLFASSRQSDTSVFLFEFTGGVWSQLGSPLVPTGASGSIRSISFSEDGEVIALGNPGLSSNRGGTWIYQGNEYEFIQRVDPYYSTNSAGVNVGQGGSVSLSSDGTSLAFGGAGDTSNEGAAWVRDTINTLAPTL